MSDLYALLIGVDFYLPNRLPSGGRYGHLAGCVRDINHVEAYLKSRLGMADSHIDKLSATNAGGSQPDEPPELWPTYANMVAAFKRLSARAQPGDRVYIHYAGHGGRAETIYPELKTDGLDEGLVPTDVGDAHAGYLRDVEIHYLLQEMVKKGLVLTVVLDSCHSGGATRAAQGEILGAMARGIGEVDTTRRPTDSRVADRETLVAAWQGQSTAQTRAAKSVSGWLLEPKGYTLLAACRANELAYEYPFNGVERNGALTHWMLDTLYQASPNFTYKMLHDRVLARVHSQFDKQTPMLQGEGDVVVFGAERIKPYYAVPVLKVVDDVRVQLNAGEAHGLTRGAQLSIFPTAEFGDQSRRIARVEVTEVDAVASWSQVIDPPPAAPIEAGAQAVLESITNISFQRNVALDIADQGLREQLAAAIELQGKGFVKLAGDNDPVHFIVEVLENGAFSIEDAGDQPIPNLRPVIHTNDSGAIERLVARLVHLARYQGVHDLSVLDTSAAQKLQVELIGNVVNRPGEIVGLRITNNQPAGSDAHDLNITVLNLSSDWSIMQIYPAGAASFQPVSPAETIDLSFEAYLPEGKTGSVDTLKVFATRATTNFRWLEMPPLDQPVTRSITRSVGMSELEQLLASVTDEVTGTRALRLVGATEDKAWTVAQVVIQIEAG